MTVRPIQTAQYQTKKSSASFLNAAVVGGTAGALSRYVLPNKNQVDTFVSSAKNTAKSRSIVKYAGIGALVALGLSFMSKIFNKISANQDGDFDKLDVLMDASADACAIIWYGDSSETNA